MAIQLSTSSLEETAYIKIKYCLLSSLNVLSSLSFPSFLLQLPFFPMLSPFLLYLYLHQISTIHFYLTFLIFWHLLPVTPEEDGGRNMISNGLHCLGHFLINAVDKAVVYHLMWMQQTTSGQKLPYCPLTSTPFKSQLLLRIPQSTMIHFFSSWDDFLPWAHGLLPFHVNALTFQLHPWSLGQCCNPSASSLVLGSMLQPFNFILGPRAPIIAPKPFAICLWDKSKVLVS